MFSDPAAVPSALASFRLEDRMLCYNTFIPKLYNWCLSLGFTPGKIVPSRAFCSDESQGFPIILITKHFGAFPFNHGRVGGIVSTDRHAPHADHAKDLVLVQASHVGYEPETGDFGTYRRLHTTDAHHSCSCGKIGRIIEWYAREYAYASENVRLLRHEGQLAVLIDYMLIARQRQEGLFLHATRLVAGAERGQPRPAATRSTGHIFLASPDLIARLGEDAWPVDGSIAIGKRLAAEDFYFRHKSDNPDPFQDQLESNLITPMPWILSSRHPLLTAACANTLAEFERTYRSLVQTPAMAGRNLIFLSGLNIDISPLPGDEFPQTKFVPWAAFVQHANGHREILEQDQLFETLSRASRDNPAQMDLEKALAHMSQKRDTAVQF
ncbi:hypothetical protein F8A86_06350 [Betaproteobacteria bacterium SCN1]|jgi:hypothetical protein|nr:hypothetical protein F8A86_06350 [Betaproteobacteria bacterium SCN1]MBN8758895.1 hypothetical protein [Thiobacillus sp.]ODU90994.1 MAG: hypothetical protein ABT21_02990 [Thiobacillus sp. SCN 65-179]OJW37897.1 MAG: hypothetical protein BGO61_10155 [Thiobacillus sp. 65-69]